MSPRAQLARDQRRVFWDGRLSDFAAANSVVCWRWIGCSFLAVPIAVLWWWFGSSRDVVGVLIPVVVAVVWFGACWGFALDAGRRAVRDTAERYHLESPSRVVPWRSPETFDTWIRAYGDIDTALPVNRRGFDLRYDD